MVRVYRVRDAIGAYCLDCQRGVGDWSTPWHWRKSQVMHERGTASQGAKHKTIMYALR